MTTISAVRSIAFGEIGRKLALWFAFAAGATVIALGWIDRDNRLISAEHGLGYALGVLSLMCMLLLLLYPIRKRFRALAFIGTVRDWFRRHQQLGAVATLLALFHSNFQVGSPNSQIALVSTLLIGGSGLFGRFLYRYINRRLSGRRTDLKSARKALLDDRFPENRAIRCLPLLKQRIHRFDLEVLDAGTKLRGSVRTLFKIRGRTRREQAVLITFFRQQLAKEASRQPLLEKHSERLGWAMDRYLSTHMQRLQLVAELQAYERVFALWHHIHVTCFVLLVFSVALHVVAVHVY